MAGARALWRATGMKTEDFQKPIVAIANSFTQFVPGHVHLHPIGQKVKEVIDQHGGYGVEFNTIAVDDGIAMGHDGMLYSLPSRELIADSVEYMVQAHKADAPPLVCISNCDKITPGMLLAALRLNIPAIFVSGGPMEAGKTELSTGRAKLDLVDSMVAAADPNLSDEDVAKMEEQACPTCGSCSGMFTANSMNCLNEAIGLALPGNGTILATHALRWELFAAGRGKRIVEMAKAFYLEGDASVLPRSIANFAAFENAMTLDIAMGGSTNTVLHLLAMAREAEVNFTMADIDPALAAGPLHLQSGTGHAGVSHRGRRTRWWHYEHSRRVVARRQNPPRAADRCRGVVRRPDRRKRHSRVRYSRSDGRAAGVSSPGQRADENRLLPEQLLRRVGHGRSNGLHPLGRTRLFAGRRAGRAFRQHRRRRVAS